VKPFTHEVVNVLCSINEIMLSVIATIQVIFITNIKEVSVIIWTGWVMVGLMATMILINFIFVFSYMIFEKFRKKKTGSTHLNSRNEAERTLKNNSQCSSMIQINNAMAKRNYKS
jgi:uncharacterized membrane protein